MGGELGNSTASDLTYLEPFWERFKALRLNTILAPVYLDLVEPMEGHFDFSLVDGDRNAVIMVQPENAIGMIPEARHHSEIADSRSAEAVPKALMEYLVRHRKDLDPEFRDRWDRAGGRADGTWEEAFAKGPHTDEVFMAWHFARYTEQVAAKENGSTPCRCSSKGR